MKSGDLAKLATLLLVFVLTLVGCGGGGGGGGNPAPTPVSITVTPSSAVVPQGSTQQYTALETFSDGSTQDVTGTAAWSSADSSIATISSTGAATAIAPGSTAITATVGGLSGSTSILVSPVPVAGNANEVPITVNGSFCSPDTSSGYINKPCVSVTICQPGTSNCQTIGDILLDTGSFGLRLFKQAVTVPLSQVPIGSGSLAECVQFADGTSNWGSVQVADVKLGNEPATPMRIQVIDAAFGTATRPTACSNADTSPIRAGYTGVLGVGVFAEDCGSGCESSPNNGMYYSCNGTDCSGSVAPRSVQVQNPVTVLPQDNNGLFVRLPQVPPQGASSVSGTLFLGINTRTNNIPGAVTTLLVNPTTGRIKTTLNGTDYSGFIDSGSNGYFFAAPPALASLLPQCSSPNSAWYCPPVALDAPLTLTAVNTGVPPSSNQPAPSAPVTFQIGNFTNLIATSNQVFNDIAGPVGDNSFDFGLPFFLGKDVFVGIEGAVSPLGTGPYWAY